MSGRRDRRDIPGSGALPSSQGSNVRISWPPRSLHQEEEAWLPSMDVYEIGDFLVVELELPGIKKEDIKVTILGNLLTVEGVKKESKQNLGNGERRISYLLLERKLGRFQRTIELPVTCNTREARAVHEKGILTIEFKKIANRRREPIRVPVE